MGMTRTEWENYFAECLHPLVTIGFTEDQRMQAMSDTGRCILMMQEWLEPMIWKHILDAHGFTPYLIASHKQAYIKTVRKETQA